MKAEKSDPPEPPPRNPSRVMASIEVNFIAVHENKKVYTLHVNVINYFPKC